MHYFAISLVVIVFTYASALASVELPPGINTEGGLKYVTRDNILTLHTIQLPFIPEKIGVFSSMEIFVGFFAAAFHLKDPFSEPSKLPEVILLESIEKTRNVLIDIFQNDEIHPLLFSLLNDNVLGQIKAAARDFFLYTYRYKSELLSILVASQYCEVTQGSQAICFINEADERLGTMSPLKVLIYRIQQSVLKKPSYWDADAISKCGSIPSCIVEQIGISKEKRDLPNFVTIPSTNLESNLEANQEKKHQEQIGSTRLKITSSDENSSQLTHATSSFLLFVIIVMFSTVWIH